MRILICEDERMTHRLLSKMVSGWNHEILDAFDGETSIQHALEDKPDVILLDMLYPDMDGLEVLSRVRTEPAGKTVPVIVMSGTSSEELEPSLQPFGIMAILDKPVKPEILKPLLDQITIL